MKSYMHTASNWKHVATDGNPEDGLYVALYESEYLPGRLSLVVALCSYGLPECYYGDEMSWREFSSGNDDEDVYEMPRKVVAYLPDSVCVKALKEVRNHFGDFI
jgi:hypothetical protein